MKLLKSVVLFLLCATTALAHRDRLGKISEAQLTFEDGGTILLKKDRILLLRLALVTKDGTVEVPSTELAGIDHPQIDTMELTWSTFSSGELAGVAYKCIRFKFGKPEEQAFGEYPQVEFVFYDGRYHHKDGQKKVADSQWQISSPNGGGTVSELKEPKSK